MENLRMFLLTTTIILNNWRTNTMKKFPTLLLALLSTLLLITQTISFLPAQEVPEEHILKLSSQGSSGYKTFQREFPGSRARDFWRGFYKIIRRFEDKGEYTPIMDREPFWSRLMYNDLFPDNDKGLQGQKNQIKKIFESAKNRYEAIPRKKMAAGEPIDPNSSPFSPKQIMHYSQNTELSSKIKNYITYFDILQNSIPPKNVNQLDDIKTVLHNLNKNHPLDKNVVEKINLLEQQWKEYYQKTTHGTFSQKQAQCRSKKQLLETLVITTTNIKAFNIHKKSGNIKPMIAELVKQEKIWKDNKEISIEITDFENIPSTQKLYTTAKRVLQLADQTDVDNTIKHKVDWFRGLPDQEDKQIETLLGYLRPKWNRTDPVIKVLKDELESLYRTKLNDFLNHGRSETDLTAIHSTNDEYTRLFKKKYPIDNITTCLENYFAALKKKNYPELWKLYSGSSNSNSCSKYFKLWKLMSKRQVKAAYENDFEEKKERALSDDGNKNRSTFMAFIKIKQQANRDMGKKLDNDYKERFNYLRNYFDAKDDSDRKVVSKSFYNKFPLLAKSYSIPDYEAAERERWTKWQKRLLDAYTKWRNEITSETNTANKKRLITKLLADFPEDNPYTEEDNKIKDTLENYLSILSGERAKRDTGDPIQKKFGEHFNNIKKLLDKNSLRKQERGKIKKFYNEFKNKKTKLSQRNRKILENVEDKIIEFSSDKTPPSNKKENTPQQDFEILKQMWNDFESEISEANVVLSILDKKWFSSKKTFKSARDKLDYIFKLHNNWDNLASFKDKYIALELIAFMQTRADNPDRMNMIYNHIINKYGHQLDNTKLKYIQRIIKNNFIYLLLFHAWNNKKNSEFKSIKDSLLNNNPFANSTKYTIRRDHETYEILFSIHSSLAYNLLSIEQKIQAFYFLGQLFEKLEDPKKAPPCYFYAWAYYIMENAKLDEIFLIMAGDNSVKLKLEDLKDNACRHCNNVLSSYTSISEFSRRWSKNTEPKKWIQKKIPDCPSNPTADDEPVEDVREIEQNDDSTNSNEFHPTDGTGLSEFLDILYTFVKTGKQDSQMQPVCEKLLGSELSGPEFQAIYKKYLQQGKIPRDYDQLMNRFFIILNLRPDGWKTTALQIIQSGTWDIAIRNKLREIFKEMERFY
jgi:hypothetical protein